jgi:predicted RNA-binding protein with PUA-like domain
MKPSFWLLKSEPSTYSYTDLERDGKTCWNGVRNFQARNHMKSIKKGDLALIYHSGDDKAVVGVAEVVREGYPDPDPKKKGDWVQIDLKPLRVLKTPVTLAQLKAEARMKDLILIKQSRLSVMPVSAAHFELILKLGETKL